MNTSLNEISNWLVWLTFGNLSLAIVFTTILLLKGPRLSDRVVALDLTAMLIAAMSAAHSVVNKNDSYLDVAITISLVAFLGTVAFAYYIQDLGQRKERE